MRDYFLKVSSSFLSLLARFKLLTNSFSLKLYGKLWWVSKRFGDFSDSAGKVLEKCAVFLTVSLIKEWPTLRAYLSKKFYQTMSIAWLLGIGLLLKKFAHPIPEVACLVLVLAFYYFLRLE